MMFKFAKPLLYLLIFFTIIIAVLYLTRTNKPVSTQCHHRKYLPARFHVGKFFYFIISYYSRYRRLEPP